MKPPVWSGVRPPIGDDETAMNVSAHASSVVLPGCARRTPTAPAGRRESEPSGSTKRPRRMCATGSGRWSRSAASWLATSLPAVKPTDSDSSLCLWPPGSFPVLSSIVQVVGATPGSVAQPQAGIR